MPTRVGFISPGTYIFVLPGNQNQGLGNMSPLVLLSVVLSYFGLLVLITYFTASDDSNQVFFRANRRSPWYVVAFGMIGASLSGVTFVSVPGWVESTQFSYMQVVLGYLFGYLVIAWVLIPIYYKMNVTSIYEYLNERFGSRSHRFGAFFFMVSRILIASFRLFLVASVLHHFILEEWNVPFELTVILSVAFIWLYTFRGGIRTIVWTDTLQTFFMLASLVVAIWVLLGEMNMGLLEFTASQDYSAYSKILFSDDPNAANYWLKSFLGGMFIAIAMTGLDQDNMQKNLTCKTIKSAQKNVISLGFVLIPVNFVFLFLGALLFSYAGIEQIAVPALNGKVSTDLLFPEIALNHGLGPLLASTFILGLIAAAYSSADSALTSLTTSFSVDFMDLSKMDKPARVRRRKRVHLGFSAFLVLVIISFQYLLEDNVISSLLKVSSFTYGPLLGLFAYGLFTRHQLKESFLWPVAIVSILLSMLLQHFAPQLLNGYQIGLEILLFNALFTFFGLHLSRKKEGVSSN